jgi:hypothetical protein
MFKGFSRLACGAAIVAATLAPLAAHAVIIDFEGEALTGLYFPDDSFTQNGFRMTQGFDAGIVDVGTGLGAAAPTNNTTQFYTNLNDGELIFTSLNGLPFSLNGFSAAFVPLLGSHAPAQVIGVVALATTMTGSVFGTAFGLGDTSSTTAGSPFLTFSNPANFAAFTNLKTLEFFTCAVVNGQVCTVPTQNNGQFALDNVNLTAVAAPIPEPETTALMALGLMVLTAVARRRRSR